MALKLIKNKIKSTQRTSKVTKAMEAVSAVKMRKSQERALQGRPYAEAALRILERVSKSTGMTQHALFTRDQGTHDCIIVITSDKGLAGSLNSAVLKEATALTSTFTKEQVEFICFGKKSYEHFLRRGYAIRKHYLNVSDTVEIDEMEEVVTFVTNEFLAGKYRTVYLVYQNFVSTFEQSPTLREILPLNTKTIEQMVHDILPKAGKYSTQITETKGTTYTIEPGEEAVYGQLFPMIIKIMVYHALLESKASEHSARMVAMKNATDKAREVSKELTLLYNKERQGVITAEVSEITGGIEAMSKK